MRLTSVLSGLVAVAAASIGLAAVSAPASAEPDDVVIKGRVVGTSGKPLKGVAVRCNIDTRPGQYVVTGTDADGTYSITRGELDVAAQNDRYGGCDHLWFFDPEARYITTSWPSGDGPYAGYPVTVPSREGGEPAVANGRLGVAGQLSGSATDVKDRGIFDLNVDVYSTKTRKIVANVRTSPYGGYRVLGLRPGSYKVKIGTGATSAVGYRPTYAGGGATFDAAKTFTVKARSSRALGRQSLPNIARLFTSRGKVTLSYDRPLVSGTGITASQSSFDSVPDRGSTQFAVASRAVDPRTGLADDTLPYASSVWDYDYGPKNQPLLVVREGPFTGHIQDFFFQHFVGRRFVVVAVRSLKSYALTYAASAPTVAAQ